MVKAAILLRLLSAVATVTVILASVTICYADPKKPMPDCAWGRTAEQTCVNPKLALDAQRSGLVNSQKFLNLNFSPYLPPDIEVQRQYPLFSNEWWILRIN
jgi:hypothetical protein